MRLNLPKPRAIIFDWDNTLVDTWPIIHEALNDTLTAMGHATWSLQQTKDQVSKSMRDSFPELFGEGWQKAAELYQTAYRSRHLQKLTALPGALAVLQKTREKKLHSVVVSNKKGPGLRKEVEHLGWNSFFDNIVGADDAARDKPFHDPVHLAFDKSGIAPGPDVWFIGDSEIDLECAKNCGCTAILYGKEAKDHPQYSKTHYRGFPYAAHAHNHAQTLELLERFA